MSASNAFKMNIESWVYRHFDDVRSSGSDLVVRCPFCESRVGSKDQRGHLYVNLVEPICHCFRCDYAGSWHTLVVDVEGEWSELDEQIVPLYRLLHRRNLQKQAQQMPSSFLTISDALENGNPLAKRVAQTAKDYVEMRVGPFRGGWSDLLGRWGIWDGIEGIGKLVLPVERGWWQERALDPAARPKYISAHAPKEDRLYNPAALSKGIVYIAEGIISAACLGDSAVALCGKTATPQQLCRLGQAEVRRYVICLDSDAQKEALRLAKGLASHNKEIAIRQYEDGDPASCRNYVDVAFNWRTEIERRLEC